MNLRNVYLRYIILLLAACSLAEGQPTINMLQRVMMIQYKNERGTAFSVDVDGREYWITARHILTGAKTKPYGVYREKTVDVQLLNPGGDGEQWLSEKLAVLQPADDVDVVVLVGDRVILTDVQQSPPATSDGLMFGGSCEFLGFAYGGGWRAPFNSSKTSYWLPYIKRCGVSGMDADTHLWILDGINNAGFSGGPVIAGTSNDLKIVAVISGYSLEPTEVIRGDPKTAPDAPKDTVRVNSGFILAYDISWAVDLIKKNPIGPLRHAK